MAPQQLSDRHPQSWPSVQEHVRYTLGPGPSALRVNVTRVRTRHDMHVLRARCFNFEGLLQPLKHMAANCNYRDVAKRMASFWSLRQGLALYHDRLSHIHDVALKYAGDDSIEVKHEDGDVLNGLRGPDPFLEQARPPPSPSPRTAPAHM